MRDAAQSRTEEKRARLAECDVCYSVDGFSLMRRPNLRHGENNITKRAEACVFEC